MGPAARPLPQHQRDLEALAGVGVARLGAGEELVFRDLNNQRASRGRGRGGFSRIRGCAAGAAPPAGGVVGCGRVCRCRRR